MIIAVTVGIVSRAPAEKVTGEVTVAPLAGEQILTVLLTVAVHAAEATFTEARRKVAARQARREIIRGPISEPDCPNIAARPNALT
jgi:hypothetical protein